MDNYIFNNVNKDCYHFKTIKNKSGLYDSFVDMTYVLLMENSEREKHIYDQLDKFQPTKTVKVQYNKGYKKCKKKLCDNKANWDLFDAHYNVILDAYRNNYNNILIFEDDFVVNEEFIFDGDKIKDIERFINNNDVDVYLLGTTTPEAGIMTPFNFGNHQKCNGLFNNLCLGTHGYIMNSMGIEKFLDYYNTMDCNEVNKLSSKGHIDKFYNTSFNTYLNRDPLIVQPLEMTENRKENWTKSEVKTSYMNAKIKLFNLDKTDDRVIVRSYNNLYNIGNIGNILFYTILISIIVYLYIKFK